MVASVIATAIWNGNSNEVGDSVKAAMMPKLTAMDAIVLQTRRP